MHTQSRQLEDHEERLAEFDKKVKTVKDVCRLYQ